MAFLVFYFRAMLLADVFFSPMTGNSRAMVAAAACVSSRRAAAYRSSFTSPVIMSSTRRVRYESLHLSSLGDFFSGFAFCARIRYSSPHSIWWC